MFIRAFEEKKKKHLFLTPWRTFAADHRSGRIRSETVAEKPWVPSGRGTFVHAYRSRCTTQRSGCSSGCQRGSCRCPACRSWPPWWACHQTLAPCCTGRRRESGGFCPLPCWNRNGLNETWDDSRFTFRVFQPAFFHLGAYLCVLESPHMIQATPGNLQLFDVDIWHPERFPGQRHPWKSTFLGVPAQAIYFPFLHKMQQ